MKKSTKIGLGVAAAVVAVTAIGGAVVAHERHGGWRHGYHHMGWKGGHGPHYMMNKAERMLQRHDLDKDGAVSQAELDKSRADRFKTFDGNGDGRLTLDEFQGMWVDHVRPRMVDRFQAFDDDGDGAITQTELAQPFSRIIARHDRNNDGKVDMREIEDHMRWGKRGGYRYYDDDDDDDRDDDRRDD